MRYYWWRKNYTVDYKTLSQIHEVVTVWPVANDKGHNIEETMCIEGLEFKTSNSFQRLRAYL